MATAVAVVTISESKFDRTERKNVFVGTIAVGASPAEYASDGLVCSLAVAGVRANSVPDEVRVEGQAGWFYRYVAGTTLANGKLKIFGFTPTSVTGGVIAFSEFTNATAIPAGVSGDTVQIVAKFKKGQ